MQTIFSLLRIKHWIKNFFIFLPAFFGGVLFSNNILPQLILGFFVFSLAASCIYIINDIKDVEQDKNHPKKSKRAIASGKISTKKATYIYIILLLVAAISSVLLPIEAIIVVGIYFGLNFQTPHHLDSVKPSRQPFFQQLY